MDDTESSVAEKVRELNQSLVNIHTKANEEKDFLRITEKNLDRLTKLAEEIEEDMLARLERFYKPKEPQGKEEYVRAKAQYAPKKEDYFEIE